MYFREMCIIVYPDQEVEDPQHTDTSAPILIQSLPSPTVLTSNSRNYFCLFGTLYK